MNPYLIGAEREFGHRAVERQIRKRWRRRRRWRWRHSESVGLTVLSRRDRARDDCLCFGSRTGFGFDIDTGCIVDL